MEALLQARLPATVAAVISSEPSAPGLAAARSQGITTVSIDHRAHLDRAGFDTALAREIDRHDPDLVVLAGFMRVLTESFAQRYAGRLLNIHPSLLPAFPGLNTHRRALEAGVRIHGCTVHFVTPRSTAARSSSRPRCRFCPGTLKTRSLPACSPRSIAFIRRRYAGSARGS